MSNDGNNQDNKIDNIKNKPKKRSKKFEKRLAEGKVGKANRSIDFEFGELLFKLWVSGKSFASIQQMFLGTPKEFSYLSIINHAQRENWEARKKEMMDKVRQNNLEQLEFLYTEKLRALNEVIILTTERIKIEYQEYLKNPLLKPSWMPSTMKELDILFRLHDFVASGGVEKHALGFGKLGNNTGDNGSLDDSSAHQILKILATNSTQKLIDQTKQGVIDVESNEEGVFVER